MVAITLVEGMPEGHPQATVVDSRRSLREELVGAVVLNRDVSENLHVRLEGEMPTGLFLSRRTLM
ncbi:hypothetical protein B5F79_10590 [Olsenella sp. An285]|nr:hypothetical protein B5F79_10590 [Olsenella sp. An285]